MKTTKRLLAIAIAALAFGACQKENSNVIFIEAEGMHNGTKMAIDGNHSYWVENDQVRIYNADDESDWGTPYQIHISNGQASIDVSENTTLRTPLIGLYPNEIAAGHGSGYIHVDIPFSYDYASIYTLSTGYQQILQPPMIAYTESGNTMLFKHLTGAVTVKIVNNFGIDVRVDNIRITSNLYQLSGRRSIAITDIASDPIIVDPLQTDSVDDRKVQMTFSGPQLIIASGDSALVQLPVLPVGELNKFTVSVTVVNKDDANMGYIFTKEQAHSNSLLRAQIGYTPAKFGGKFNYNGGYVHFAPGNLQYRANVVGLGGNWRFAGAQWATIGNAAGNTTAENRDSQTFWIDLFGYGTSGCNEGQNAYQPWATSTIPGDYYASDLTSDYGHPDWGVHNDISNGMITNIGTSSWKTPDWSEIFNNNDYAYAYVHNVYGIIILPVNYQHPLETPLDLAATQNINNIDLYGWTKMEIAGAVFLPAAGYRYGTEVREVGEKGYYWGCSGSSSGAYNLNILDRNENASAVDDASKGFAVRLIRVNN